MSDRLKYGTGGSGEHLVQNWESAELFRRTSSGNYIIPYTELLQGAVSVQSLREGEIIKLDYRIGDSYPVHGSRPSWRAIIVKDGDTVKLFETSKMSNGSIAPYADHNRPDLNALADLLPEPIASQILLSFKKIIPGTHGQLLNKPDEWSLALELPNRTQCANPVCSSRTTTNINNPRVTRPFARIPIN